MSKHFPPDQIGLNRYVIDDPSSQEGLTEVIPKGEIPSHYDNQYVSTTEVRCAFWPQHQRHRHGYTAVMEDGRRALIGIDCGKEHFGDFRASALRRKLKDDTQRRLRADLLAQARAGLPVVIDALSSRWVRAEREFSWFMAHLPRIRQASADGRMDQGRDYLLGRMETQMRRDPDGVERPHEIFVETGRVREIRAVWANRGRLSDALTLARALEASSARMEALGKVDEADLMEQRRVLIERLREGITWCEMAAVFLDPGNVERYGQAARRLGSHDRVEVKDRKDRKILRVKPEGCDWQSWDWPDLFIVPTDEELVGPLMVKDGSGK